MHNDSALSPSTESIPVRNGIVTLCGYGLSVSVEHGRLAVADGLGNRRCAGRFSKATCGIERLVILGHSGTLSLEAIRWLHDIRAAVIQIDADGNLLFASSPLKERFGRLRRAQALAASSHIGVEIIRYLLTKKLTGQAEFSERNTNSSAARSIAELVDSFSKVKDMKDFRLIEAQAALKYWSVWSEVEVNFARIHKKTVPPHWKRFDQRISPLTSSPRNAANPANAFLNYLYAILEAETRIALLTVGLDPAIGLMHTDQPNRDSLALDVMEAVRPSVDMWLQGFLTQNKFSKHDFFERRDGTVRLSSRITSQLAATAPLWAAEAAPVAEWVARELMASSTKKVRLPTPLTEKNRSAGRDHYRRRTSKSRLSITADVGSTCPECGKKFTDPGRQFCSNECWEKYNNEVHLPQTADAGLAKLARLRAEGRDPAHGGNAALRRGATNSQRARERTEWERQHEGIDLDVARDQYRRNTLPKLEGATLGEIVKATGLSKRYASLIRRGVVTPHPMHFNGLIDLVRERKEGSRN